MHFVAALDDVPAMRGVLALFEGVATGAADGYARMAGRPAATLLHLGPGARQRPGQPPQRPPGPQPGGQHRRRPRHLPPALRRPAAVGHRDRGPERVDVRPHLRVDGRTERRRGRGPGRRRRAARLGGHPDPSRRRVVVRGRDGGRTPRCRPDRRTAGAGSRPPWPMPRAKALRSGEPAAILVGGRACSGTALEVVADIATATGAKLLAETFPARLERGAGRPTVERLAYLAEFTAMQLEGVRHLVLVDAASPVSFFAYPGKPERPGARRVHRPSGGRCRRRRAGGGDRTGRSGRRPPAERPRTSRGQRPTFPPARSPPRACARPSGPCCPKAPSSPTRGTPRGSSPRVPPPERPPHDWLCLTGGAIGQGLPVAVGAAVAEPGPAGGRPRGRRERAVHPPVVVDDGPRGTRRDHHPPQQPLLRRAQHGAGPGRGRMPPGPEARDMLDLGRPLHRLRASGPGPRAWRPRGPTPPRRSPTSWPGRWPHRARAWWRRSSLPALSRRGGEGGYAGWGGGSGYGGGPAAVCRVPGGSTANGAGSAPPRRRRPAPPRAGVGRGRGGRGAGPG